MLKKDFPGKQVRLFYAVYIFAGGKGCNRAVGAGGGKLADTFAAAIPGGKYARGFCLAVL